jgi:arylsulfatase A-like enzyme
VIFAVEGFRGDELAPERLASGDFPALAQFRKESLSFGVAYAPGAAAVPSHAALQSSVVPAAHLTAMGTFVAQAWTVLAEVLERAGYGTQMVTANPYVSQARGLVQGMGRVETLTAGPVRGNTATHVVSAALPEEGTRKFPGLTYMVMNDPQAPYDPPKAFLQGLSAPEGAPAQHLTHMWVGRVRRGRDVSHQERRYVRSLYRGELQLVDVALGNTLESLAAGERLRDAIVVVVGIHGEEFLEHGGAGHGLRLFEESLRVPLLIWAPELLAPGEVSVPVDLLDLAPTLLDLVGIEAPADWQGRSWVSVIDDPQPPPQVAAASLGDGSFMIRAHDLKLLVGPSVGRDGLRLYDLATDPSEQRPMDAGGGIGMRMMRTAATWHQLEFGRWKRLRWGTAVNLLPAFALDHGM